MSDRATRPSKSSVTEFINALDNDTRRQDSKAVVQLMRRVSGKRATMWGPSIIGFGTSHYQLASGKPESICKIGFSPRKSSLVFYLGTIPNKQALFARLGKYKTSKPDNNGCLYINKLADVDLVVLEEIITGAWQHEGSC